MSLATPVSIGVILCSSRQPRVCPQIAAFVTSTLENRIPSLQSGSEPDANPSNGGGTSSQVTSESGVVPQVTDELKDTTIHDEIIPPAPPPPTLHLIDLTAWNLPLFDEPGIPSQIKTHSQYTHPHTCAWSQEIQKYAAFIFILPQYNWGYPAVIKNAIDFLYHEWGGKAAMIVSYGGHGGTKSAGQLRQVLQAVRMNVADTMPALSFPGREALARAAKGEQLGMLGEGGIWDAEREGICKAFEELMGLVSSQSQA